MSRNPAPLKGVRDRLTNWLPYYVVTEAVRACAVAAPTWSNRNYRWSWLCEPHVRPCETMRGRGPLSSDLLYGWVAEIYRLSFPHHRFYSSSVAGSGTRTLCRLVAFFLCREAEPQSPSRALRSFFSFSSFISSGLAKAGPILLFRFPRCFVSSSPGPAQFLFRLWRSPQTSLSAFPPTPGSRYPADRLGWISRLPFLFPTSLLRGPTLL